MLRNYTSGVGVQETSPYHICQKEPKCRGKVVEQTETPRRDPIIYDKMLAYHAKRWAELHANKSCNNRGRLLEETETMRRNILNYDTMAAYHAKRAAELHAKRRLALSSLPAERRLTHQYHPYRKETKSSLPPGTSQNMESDNNRGRLVEQTETILRINLLNYDTMVAHAKRTGEFTKSSLHAAGRRRGRLVEQTETMRRNLLNHDTMVAYHANRTAELTKSFLPAGRTTENAVAAQVEIPRPDLASHFRNLSLDHSTTSFAETAIPRPELDSYFCNLSLNHPTTSSSPDETAV